MDALLRLLLTNAALSGLLALAAWAASRVVRRQAVVHALWLLALVKLVTPPLVGLPLLPARANVARGDLRPAVAQGVSLSTVPATISRPEASPMRTASIWEPRRAGPESTGRARTATPPALPRITAAARRLAVPAVLLFGALAVAGLTALRFARFRRLVSDAEPAPPALAARAATLAGRLGVKRAPPLCLVPARVSPMLWPASTGPLLLLPRDLLTELADEELDALLAHELAHVRRRDHWVRFLEIAATALFWWYPITWWARRALRRAEERCCDEWVLRALPSSARAYANAILKSLTFIADASVPLPAAASGAGRIEDLEARLKEILMTHPLPRLSRPRRLALCATALAPLALFPTVAKPRPAEAAAVVVLPDTGNTPSPAPPAATVAPALAPAAPRTPPPALPAAIAPAQPAPLSRPVVVGAVRVAPPVLAASVHPLLARVGEEPDPGLEAERRSLEDQRRQLRLSQLELERRSLELEARVQQKELAGEGARFRAEGDVDGAARVEKRGALNARRLELERRQLDFQVQQVGLETELERAAEEGAKDGGSEEKLRATEKAEQELEKKRQALESEAEKLDQQMQALDTEERVLELRGATEEYAKALSAQVESLREVLPEAGAQKAELEREIERLEAALGALRGGPLRMKSPRPSTPVAR